MTDPARVRRHAERVRELVASVVRTQIKDPRLGMITITDARITADLRDATVFYTVLGDAAAEAGTKAALDSANGLLRSTVGKALGLRHSPTLTFVLDNVQEHAKHIDDLLAAARNADAEVQRLAANARYAGDAQPYREDADAEDADADDDEADDDAPASADGADPGRRAR
ncbi:30S ribosome-binding factor RbfA [Solwaraspora sp. WMMD791]|uniref:30S ribosome-binding factor RbfA n=1 Tax=Solwaraspora sp. WMMD791 TaxID=3016086 RepID=UPI00249BB92E|nr:30S ribosome-binding factor RbfA [Solwaraspora sp. WMMD791]WFE27412.1 30S ribosome-binding factor RbfA [Solwaraspora sp. WMMD791]